MATEKGVSLFEMESLGKEVYRIPTGYYTTHRAIQIPKDFDEIIALVRELSLPHNGFHGNEITLHIFNNRVVWIRSDLFNTPDDIYYAATGRGDNYAYPGDWLVIDDCDNVFVYTEEYYRNKFVDERPDK